MTLWKYLLAAALVLATATEARSITLADCFYEAPHYFFVPAGQEPGAVLADLFLLPGTLAISTATLGSSQRGNANGRARALCMPLLLARHAVYLGGKPH